MDQYSVLIVDDEKFILDVTSKALEPDGYQIFTAENADDALTVLRKNKIHLIITDQKMPGLSGLEFLKEIKSDYPDIVTIMITGFADIKVAVEAINTAGIYKFLLKPWEGAELRMTVKRALEFRLLLMERDALLEQLSIQKDIFREMEKAIPGIVEKERKQIEV